mmetsp:Transcript_35975/g.66309  ORF Transcript_35975/g.66309 Transcript_35975/m.66309 type:complete len:269 (+) Transcript_35975:925-1731(+)
MPWLGTLEAKVGGAAEREGATLEGGTVGGGTTAEGGATACMREVITEGATGAVFGGPGITAVAGRGPITEGGGGTAFGVTTAAPEEVVTGATCGVAGTAAVLDATGVTLGIVSGFGVFFPVLLLTTTLGFTGTGFPATPIFAGTAPDFAGGMPAFATATPALARTVPALTGATPVLAGTMLGPGTVAFVEELAPEAFTSTGVVGVAAWLTAVAVGTAVAAGTVDSVFTVALFFAGGADAGASVALTGFDSLRLRLLELVSSSSLGTTV